MPRLTATGQTNCALLLPLAERGEVAAVVMLVRRLSVAFDEHSIELAGTLVDQAATALALVRARTEAGTDPVAGCMNHRAMRRRLDEEIVRAARTGNPLSCLLMDLDNFKLVNDRHGHQAGDATLRGVVQALVGEFRAFDRVARYGGDEFVVILPNADLDSATAAATRALERLRALPSLQDESGVSASIGVAQWQAPMTTDELLAACDVALLRSKRQGKGRVTSASAGDPLGSGPRRRGPHSARPEDSAKLQVRPDRPNRSPGRAPMSENSFNAKDTLAVGGREYEIFRLDALQQRFDVARLPFSLKVLLENLLRTEGNGSVSAADIEALAGWDADAQPSREIAFTPGAGADAGLHGRARGR